MSVSALFAVVLAAATPASADDWEATLETAVEAVVQLKYLRPRSFEEADAGASQATGFVVDAERGIILTNRHVVGTGPIDAKAVFLNHEEVALEALYRDPVHDFAFFGFDPAEVEHAELVELTLAPEEARVGVEIRVVGNDAGEKLSILDGTLARLDRTAPFYGHDRYNDFNTFYYQAASSTSGGSSGSPWLAATGKVVSLNAGGSRKAASGFSLPLWRVKRALELLQAGEPVPRGGVMAEFKYTPYDELRRQGLSEAAEAEARATFPDATGLLWIRGTQTGGPADGRLKPGDVILRVAGEPLAGFVALEERLDAAVGTEVVFGIERDGQALDVSVPVADLHAATPSGYLELSNAVLTEYSYQQARTRGMPVGGLFVARQGYALDRAALGKGWVIVAIGGEPTPTLDAAEAALGRYAEGHLVELTAVHPTKPRKRSVFTMEMDWTWFPARRCDRGVVGAEWTCRDLPPPADETPATSIDPGLRMGLQAATKVGAKVARSLVQIEFDAPFITDGQRTDGGKGTGLVVDAAGGLVVTDREAVRQALGDVTVVVGAALRVPAEVVALHPVHNLAFVRYDPAAVPPGTLASAVLDPRPLSVNEDVHLVGLTAKGLVVDKEMAVANLLVPALRDPKVAQFKATNVDFAYLSELPQVAGGVLADRRGRVRALAAAYTYRNGKKMTPFLAGLPAEVWAELVSEVLPGPLGIRDLGVELGTTTLAEARRRGLDDATLAALADTTQQPGVLTVVRTQPGSPAAEVLQDADLILYVDGEPALRARDLELAAREAVVELTMLRAGAVLTVEVAPVPLDTSGTTRVVQWAGLLVQAPHREVGLQTGIDPGGAYISQWYQGSPAERGRAFATKSIVEVDGVPVTSLDDLLAVAAEKRDGSVRVTLQEANGRTVSRTLELDPEFWPTIELVRGDDGRWLRVER